MLKTLFRPYIIRRFNIRTKCDAHCKERCTELLSKQTDYLDRITNYTHTLLIISAAQFLAPVIVIGATGIASLINHIMH